MSREASLGIVVAVIALVVIVAAAAGAFGVRVTTEVSSDPPTGPPPRDGTGLVVGQHQSGGLSLFGLSLRSPTYTLQVALIPPPGCAVVDTESGETLPSGGACEGVPASGPVAGGGRTSEGDTIVAVAVEVSKACYQAVENGGPWPSTAPECR